MGNVYTELRLAVLANVVVLLAFWVGVGVAGARAEVIELDSLVAEQLPDDPRMERPNATTAFFSPQRRAMRWLRFPQKGAGLARPDGGLTQDSGQLDELTRMKHLIWVVPEKLIMAQLV